MNDTQACNHPGQTPGIIISLIIHMVAVALVLSISGYCVQKRSELVTILLNQGNPLPILSEKAGGDGKKPGSAGPDKSASGGTPKASMRHITKLARENVVKTDYRTIEKKKADDIKAAQISPDPSASVEAVPELTGQTNSIGSGGIAGVGQGLGGGGGAGMGAYGSGSGFGGQGRGGVGKGAGSGRGSADEARKHYLREHYKYIRDLIAKHITYPSTAKKMGWTGNVTVSFVILETGLAESIKVVKSSGYAVLDENVVDAVKDVQPFPKPPVAAQIHIPIRYNLDRT